MINSIMWQVPWKKARNSSQRGAEKGWPQGGWGEAKSLHASDRAKG